MVGLTTTWALELAQYGITVNSIAPGPIDTELFRELVPYGSEKEKEIILETPMGRIGKAVDIAAIIKFMLSDDAGYITGQNICIDGGRSLI